ncbi:MAG TPA: transglutaminase family protein [Chloroflexota bacterium]|nr:transglutaminase family protein [Chloroflexota bacterium]
MQVRIGCEFQYEVPVETPSVVQVQPHEVGDHRLIRETWETTPGIAGALYHDLYGNTCRRLILPKGAVTLRYDAICEVPDRFDEIAEDAEEIPIADLPDEALIYTMPSRYCLSDVLGNTAWALFGQAKPGWARVQAICDWVHHNLRFQYGTSTPLTTAVDVYVAREGVCRDFTQLGISFCRALNIPARYVFGYLPDIGVPPPDAPMDFCAWFEAYLGDRWYTFDPRNNAPRTARVVIGRGRDALDVAMVTSYGAPRLTKMEVWADEYTGGAQEPERAAEIDPDVAAQEGAVSS